MRYSYAQKSAILQKILSKIQKEFRFCNTDEEIDLSISQTSYAFIESERSEPAKNRKVKGLT